MHFSSAVFVLALTSIACHSVGEDRIAAPPAYELSFQIVEAPTPLVVEWIHPERTDYPILSEARAAEFLAAVKRDGSVTSRPRLIVSSGTTGSISNSHEIEYTGDVDANEQLIQSTIEAGLFIDATPTEREDGRTDVALSIRETQVVEPIREVQLTPAGSKNTFTIQLPESESCTVNTTVILSADQTALIPMSALSATPFEPGGSERSRVAVLRVRPQSSSVIRTD